MKLYEIKKSVLHLFFARKYTCVLTIEVFARAGWKCGAARLNKAR